jgi:hypothetical protein
MGKTQMAYENSTMTQAGQKLPPIGNLIFARRTKADKALHQLPCLDVKVLDSPNQRPSTPLAARESQSHNGIIEHV